MFAGTIIYNNYDIKKLNMSYKKMQKVLKEKGITLIALVITILFSYDEKLKCSNGKGFFSRSI